MTKVLVFGAFDGLHPGHLDFFLQAKKFGDFLIVSVGTDKNVEKIKGKKALFNQDERVALVSHLDVVDEAVIGSEEDFYKHIAQIAPDVICLGYDQWASEEEVRSGLRAIGLSSCRVVRLKPFDEGRAKSTHLKNKSVDF